MVPELAAVVEVVPELAAVPLKLQLFQHELLRQPVQLELFSQARVFFVVLNRLVSFLRIVPLLIVSPVRLLVFDVFCIPRVVLIVLGISHDETFLLA